MNEYNFYGDVIECENGPVSQGRGAVVDTDSIIACNMEADDVDNVDIRDPLFK